MEEKVTSKPSSKRRLETFAILFGLLLWILFQYLGQIESLDEQTTRLLRKHIIIDTHNDLPWGLRKARNGSLNIDSLPNQDTDVKRMRQGHLTGQIWSAYVGCSTDYSTPNDYILETLEQIDIVKRFVNQNSNDLEFVDRADNIMPSFKKGKISSLIGIEGGHQIDNSLAVLRQYYTLGVRYMTLTHVCHTAWADSAAIPPIHNGLTVYGKKVVAEMNRLGMMVDISHVSHKVMRDVVEISQAPLFASHSSSYSICKTERNIPDDILEAMKVKDGVIMINFWPNLISCSNNSTIDQVVDHILHVIQVAGSEHVGFGADYDGIDTKTNGLEDVSKYPLLIRRMLERGIPEHEVVGIMGQNLIRVLKRQKW